MDLNPQFFDECTANYKQQRIESAICCSYYLAALTSPLICCRERQRQRNRDEAWQHLRDSILNGNTDKSKLPSNFDLPLPPMDVADVSLMDDDYSIEGDEQMSFEGPSVIMDDTMEEDGDQHVELVSLG